MSLEDKFLVTVEKAKAMKTEQIIDGGEQGGSLIRLKQAAARCGVSVRTLYRIIAEGGLSLVRIRGCSCLKESDLAAYVEKSKQRRNHD